MVKTNAQNNPKGKPMKRLTFITMLLSTVLLAGCDELNEPDPQITKVKTTVIEKNKDNYQTVARAEIEVNTKEPVEVDPLNQDFNDNCVIHYYDKDNKLITNEYTHTIQEAINQSKFGQTLIRNNGVGMRVDYTVQYKDQIFYKAHSKEKSITVPRKVNIKNVDATELSLHTALNNDKEDTFEWTGKADPKVNTITITEDKSRGGLIGPAIDDLSTLATGDEHKHIQKYKYEDNKLKLISEYDK